MLILPVRPISSYQCDDSWFTNCLKIYHSALESWYSGVSHSTLCMFPRFSSDEECSNSRFLTKTPTQGTVWDPTVPRLRAQEGESQLLKSPSLLFMYHAHSIVLSSCSLLSLGSKNENLQLPCWMGFVLDCAQVPVQGASFPSSAHPSFLSTDQHCHREPELVAHVGFPFSAHTSCPSQFPWCPGDSRDSCVCPMNCLPDHLFLSVFITYHQLCPWSLCPKSSITEEYTHWRVGPLQTRWGPERPVFWCVVIYSKCCQVTWNSSELSSVICQYQALGASKVTNF